MIKKSSLCDVAKQRPEKQKSKQKLLLIKKFNEINKHASKFVGTLSFEEKDINISQERFNLPMQSVLSSTSERNQAFEYFNTKKTNLGT